MIPSVRTCFVDGVTVHIDILSHQHRKSGSFDGVPDPIYVCVCVTEKGKEREREREKGVCVCVCVCVYICVCVCSGAVCVCVFHRGRESGEVMTRFV